MTAEVRHSRVAIERFTLKAFACGKTRQAISCRAKGTDSLWLGAKCVTHSKSNDGRMTTKALPAKVMRKIVDELDYTQQESTSGSKASISGQLRAAALKYWTNRNVYLPSGIPTFCRVSNMDNEPVRPVRPVRAFHCMTTCVHGSALDSAQAALHVLSQVCDNVWAILYRSCSTW